MFVVVQQNQTLEITLSHPTSMWKTDVVFTPNAKHCAPRSYYIGCYFRVSDAKNSARRESLNAFGRVKH